MKQAVLATIEFNHKQFQRQFFLFIRDIGNRAISNTAKILEDQLPPIIQQSLKESSEYNSILSGILAKEFGIRKEERQTALDDITNTITKPGVIEYKQNFLDRNLVGGLTINIIHKSFRDFLGLGSVRYNSNQHSIEWLDWLLFRGKDLIITDYRIKYFGEGVKRTSRTNDPLMIQGGNWRLPEGFDNAQQDDNFITRAVLSRKDQIETLITNTVITEFKRLT